MTINNLNPKALLLVQNFKSLMLFISHTLKRLKAYFFNINKFLQKLENIFNHNKMSILKKTRRVLWNY